jgi:hypothetical protein
MTYEATEARTLQPTQDVIEIDAKQNRADRLTPPCLTPFITTKSQEKIPFHKTRISHEAN